MQVIDTKNTSHCQKKKMQLIETKNPTYRFKMKAIDQIKNANYRYIKGKRSNKKMQVIDTKNASHC